MTLSGGDYFDVASGCEAESQLGEEQMPEQKPNVSFPKWKYHRTGKSVIVHDADAEAALGEGWRDSPAEPFGLPAGSDPVHWSDSWDLPRFNPDASVRIKAGLLDAHADVIESRGEDGSRVREVSMRKAFDMFAKEYLAAGVLTESMLVESIPKDVYDAAVAGGWETGTLERNSRCTLRFGHYWVPEQVPQRLKELFAAQVWRWQAKALESKLQSGEPVLSGTPGAEGPAQSGPETAHTEQPITEGRGNAARGRQHGFKADTDRHNTVADIVGQRYAPWRSGSTGWRKDSVLKSICADLDRHEIAIPETWRTGKTKSLKDVRVTGWGDALDLGYKKLITDHIRYSLGMALKKTAPAVGETESPT